jgi:hypothetical protein
MKNQKTNPIVEAYEQGKRIRRKTWDTVHWLKKHSDILSVTTDSWFNKKSFWNFDTNPEEWEVWYEDAETETPEEPQTDAIQQAIDLLKANGYEIYQITKTKL